MGITIRMVGGPDDGRAHTIPDNVPPPLYRIPIVPSLADLLAKALEPAPTQTADYEPLLENGRPRRADDGAYLYRHRAAPLSPEARRALEDARREMRAVEEQRAAEMDEAWREIRKVRPHYPADWRDL